MQTDWTPIVSIHYLDFLRMAEQPVADVVKELERIRVAVKTASGYYWDNAHWRVVDIYGREYAFQIYNRADQCGELALWDYRGMQAVGNFFLANDQHQRTETFKAALKAAQRWSDGEYQCAGCADWFEKPAVGHIYAGQYCATCVNTDSYRRDKDDEGK